MICTRCNEVEDDTVYLRDVPQAGGVTYQAVLCAGCAAEVTYVAPAPPVEVEEVSEAADDEG